MIQNLGLTVSGGINYPMWYICVLFWGSIFLHWSCKKINAKYLGGYLVSLTILGFVMFILTKSIENWGFFGIVYAPLLRGVSEMSLGLLTAHYQAKSLKYYNIFTFCRVMFFCTVVFCIIVGVNSIQLLLFSVIIFTISSLISSKQKLLRLNWFDYIISQAIKYEYVMYCNHAVAIIICRKVFSKMVIFNRLIQIVILFSVLICLSHIIIFVENKIYLFEKH